MLSEEQLEFACKMMCLWMNVCEDNGRSCSSADVSHSALLRRLLRGEPLHEKPPPTRFSYPAWELVEADEVEIREMHPYRIGDPGELSIDQHHGYFWEDEEAKIIVYPRLGLRFKYEERKATPQWYSKKYYQKPPTYMGKFLKRLRD